MKQMAFTSKINLRYVNDIFAIFDDNLSIARFLNLLNKQHSNMQFTMEKSMQALPFLDVHVQIRENELDLSVWQKETNTGILLIFNAVCPNVWKSSLVLCLLNRAKSTCSSQHLFEVEIGKLKCLFYDNNYPTWFFDKIYKFKAKLFDKPADEISVVNNVELCPIFVPYVGEASICFVKALSRLCLKQFDVRLLPLYRTNKVGQYFQLKSKTPLPLCSNVVYKFTCSSDTDLTYIGMSSRHLITRVKEHLNLADSRKNAIKDHILSCPICYNLQYNINSFTILKRCNSDYEAKIHEALLIKRHSIFFFYVIIYCVQLYIA